MSRLDPYYVFKDKHVGKKCTVLLNGPSLNAVPLDWGFGITFGSNLIYKTYIPRYYVNIGQDHFQEDSLILDIMNVMDDDRCEAAFLNRLGIHVFRHTKAFSIISSAPYSACPPEQVYGFSFDPLVTVGVHGSVLYPILQIAYYMGFKTVRLVGFDYNYVPGAEHFYPHDGRLPDVAPGERYDFDSEKWREANRPVLTACKEIYEENGREIVNWTPESHCDIFRRENPPWLG
jgi:hypothetical protein